MNRRDFLATSGGLLVSFSLPAFSQEKLQGSLAKQPLLDSWIRIDPQGRITVLTGKAELGQGVKTAILQIASEQLAVSPSQIELVTADTESTPNEGYTAGSRSMQDSGSAVRHAAAQARDVLIDEASKRLGVPAAQLVAQDGQVRAPDGRSVSYGTLVAGQTLHVEAKPQSRLNGRGKPLARVDIPAKVTGGAAYVQDLHLPGMVHGRIVRPPAPGAALQEFKPANLPGVLNVVRDGSFLGVIAEREWQAVKAMRALRDGAKWSEGRTLPGPGDIYALLARLPKEDSVIAGKDAGQGAGRVLEATFHRPYQMHAAIGPSCAVALLRDGRMTVWTHSQGVYPLRDALAELLGMASANVHCIHLEGSGCYGHNAADDVAADAALLARAVPGRPVRVQWMREDEHAWEPYGAAMVTKVRATLDAGRITSWHYEVLSNTHSTRPGPAGNLLAAAHLAKPIAPPPPRPLPQPEGGGDRNAIPLYRFPETRVTSRFIPEMPLRVSALRALGAYMNVFSIESFVDELAAAANADPVEFRLRHLDDPRARDVIALAAEKFGWQSYRKQNSHGRGFAFARYKNLATYMALAMEVVLERETGDLRVQRAVAAIDAGEIVSLDGVKNQVEGGILQSVSWTTFEAVGFERKRITSRDWASYPVLRFSHVPRSVEVHVIDRPGERYLGAGEAAQGPAAAALANALAHAAGVRLRELPLERGRLKAALAA